MNNEAPEQFSLPKGNSDTKRVLNNIIITVGVAIAIGVGIIIFGAISTEKWHKRDELAMQTADSVIAYMKDNDMRWPKSWEALEPYNLTSEMKREIIIKWNASPQVLVEHEYDVNVIPFKVITLKSGQTPATPHRGPNRKILKFLKENLKTND